MYIKRIYQFCFAITHFKLSCRTMSIAFIIHLTWLHSIVTLLELLLSCKKPSCITSHDILSVLSRLYDSCNFSIGSTLKAWCPSFLNTFSEVWPTSSDSNKDHFDCWSKMLGFVTRSLRQYIYTVYTVYDISGHRSFRIDSICQKSRRYSSSRNNWIDRFTWGDFQIITVLYPKSRNCKSPRLIKGLPIGTSYAWEFTPTLNDQVIFYFAEF